MFVCSYVIRLTAEGIPAEKVKVFDCNVALKEAEAMSGHIHDRAVEHKDPVGEWIHEATQEFFGDPREPITETMVAKAAVGFLVVVAGLAIIVSQIIGAA